MLHTYVNNVVRYLMRLRQEDTYNKVLSSDELGLFNSWISFIEVGYMWKLDGKDSHAQIN